MMQIVLPRSWKEEFALAAAMRREDILHREKMARLDALSRQRTDEARIQHKHREQELAVLEAALAPPQRVMEFRTQIDTYDTKTVEALMDNQEALAAVGEKIDDMLGKAQVLPDGRRVFKTMDGQKIYDEHGQELSIEQIDPASIDDKKPRWEPYRDAKAEDARLMREREQLHDYQAKLDHARERLDKGEITNGELKAMDTELTAAMPETVRAKLGLEKPKAEVAQELQTNAPSATNTMDALMRQTRLGPAPAAP